MSILLKWKNKLQDPPSTCESKIREFDERVCFLKNENVRLHERIDQLEALCTSSVDTHQARFLEEHIRQLEQENGRLCAENHCQRQEYERFLDQLTTMVLRTAVMQENIRKECASIYHLIERLSTLTTRAIQDRRLPQIEHRTKLLRSLSWEHLNLPCDFVATYPFLSASPKTTAEFIRHLCRNHSSSSSSLSSCSSTTTQCSFSTTGSWTLDLSFYDKGTRNPSTILPIPISIIEPSSSSPVKQNEESNNLQRSETFIVSKVTNDTSVPSISINRKEKSPSMSVHDRPINSNVQRCSTTRTIASNNSAAARPSRLPSRCSNTRPAHTSNSCNTKASAPTTVAVRSSSVKKVSKLPIRTAVTLPKSSVTTKKSSVQTSVSTKTKKETNITSVRQTPTNHQTQTKKTSRQTEISQISTNTTSAASKIRSRSSNTPGKNHSDSRGLPVSLNKRTKVVTPIMKKPPSESSSSSKATMKTIDEKSPCSSDKMNSTSSESSIEENQPQQKLITVMQDEGYSTWSSSDVKDDRSSNDSKRIVNEERHRNAGLVKDWLNTSKKPTEKKPVKEVETDKLEEFTRELSDGTSMICPFVRNRCANGIVIPHSSNNTSAPVSALIMKDISLDSLESADNHIQCGNAQTKPVLATVSSSSSSGTFSRSETFERILNQDVLSPCIVDDLMDSTESTCSDSNHLCAMSEYIEDNFLDQDNHQSSDVSSFNKTPVPKPEKRLLFPGLLNRLIFFRRVLSDSDLRQKVCCIAENEMFSHVYHAETIHEHSIELNLSNTYGSESELHVWSHDCAEQRSDTNDPQTSTLENNSPETKLAHIERLIRMTLDDPNDEDGNLTEFDTDDYNQQLALERQTLLQQIYEYPWLLQEDDIDQATVHSSPSSHQPLLSPSPDLVVPSHNPDFYQLCALTNSTSFAASFGNNSRHTTPPIASSVL